MALHLETKEDVNAAVAEALTLAKRAVARLENMGDNPWNTVPGYDFHTLHEDVKRLNQLVVALDR